MSGEHPSEEYMSNKKRLKKRSDVWDYFDESPADQRVICKDCGGNLSAQGGTSHLKRHLVTCKKRSSGDIARDAISNIPMSGEPPSKGSKPNKRRLKKRSEVWVYFDETPDDLRAICKDCGSSLSGSSKGGTSHLKRHLESCKRHSSGDFAQAAISNITMSGEHPNTGSKSNKKKLKKRSEVWDYFDETPDDLRVICKDCGSSLSRSSKGGTSHLKRHLESCKRCSSGDIAQANTSNTIISGEHPSEGSISNKKRLKKRSEVWDYFDEMPNVQRAICKDCGCSLSGNGGTSHLKRHLAACKRRLNEDITQAAISIITMSGGHPIEESTSNKKRLKKRSKVWDYFDENLDLQRAICKDCGSSLSGSSKGGTSHLKRHLETCKRRSNGDIAQAAISIITMSGGCAIEESMPKNKRLKKRSKVWDYFDETPDLQRAICKDCGSNLSGNSKGGTSHLNRHLETCRKRSNGDVSQPVTKSPHQSKQM